MPVFPEFYLAVTGREPFPWQKRLAERVATPDKQWPAEISIPTGLGKTACLDIAVWWLASQADRPPETRTAPTRIWWVVNRRLLVDSTTEHAEAIANALRDPDSLELDRRATAVLASIAHRLRSLSADPGAAPLEVIRLRGGIASRTPTDPSRPAILLCTLPMYGSRLLFRGYGSTLRAVDAAMAGTDSLVLLDEAHLAPHLRALFPAVADCTPGAQAILGEARSSTRLVTLTATGDDADGQPFGLDDEDEAHPVVRQRLDAAKPLELRIEAGDSARHLTDAALDLIRDAVNPAACVVFANTPQTARETFGRLRKTMAEAVADVLLLIGLTREREAERIRAWILDREHGMAATRDGGGDRPRHLIVVATQTLEVGADIDAEYLVTEACGVRALTQRLGRLNRLGRHTHARAVYVHVPPPKSRRGSGNSGASLDTWPVYGEEPASVLQRLQDARGGDGTGTVNLSPGRVAEVLGPPRELLGRAPEVLPEILREWTKTTTPPEGEAPVEPYFSGITGPQYTVSLIWRVHVPDDGQRLWPRASDREAVDVSIGEVRDILGDDELCRLSSDGVTVETAGADLRPGDQIVLPNDRGLLDAFGWNPTASESVVDTSLVGRGLPLDARAIERLCGVALGGLIGTALGITDDEEDVDQVERDEAVKKILTAVTAAPTPAGWDQAEWTGFTGTLISVVVEARKEVPRLRAMSPTPESRSGEFDETSLGATAVELEQHGMAVAARAREIARCIGLSSDLTDVVERAGLLHDVGKSDRRFQRWLDSEVQRGALVAKSNAPRHLWESMRIAAGWPRGGRHEDLSARLVRAWLKQNPAWGDPVQRDLLLHLVISHHGKGRPLVPPVPDGTPAVVSGLVAGAFVEVPANLALVDWDQPARFRRLSDGFGPWGLVLLEAIVIRADHAVSVGADVELEPGR